MRRLAVAVAGMAMVALAAVVPAQAQGGLGLSPTVLDFGDLGAGGTAVAALTIESGAPEALVLAIDVTGEQAAWFSVHGTADDAVDGVAPLRQIELSPGAPTLLHVRLSVPLDFAERERIEAGLQLVEVQAAGQDVALGVEVPLRAQVGGELVVRGVVESIEVPLTDPGEPVEVRARVRNEGNSLLVVEADGTLFDADGVEVSAGATRALIRVGQEQLMTLSLAGPDVGGPHRVEARFSAGGVGIEQLVRDLEIGQAVPTPDTPAERGSEGRGTVVWGAVAIGLAALTGAVLVARHEVGDRQDGPKRAGREVDGAPPQGDERTARPVRAPKEGTGRHSAGDDGEAWQPGR